MPAPRLALWGTFDVDNYGDHLFPRVAVRELERRLPGAAIDAFAPYGWLHPTPLDAGPPVSPLGPWTEGQAARVAAVYDAVMVGGGEIIHLNDPLLAPVYGAPAAEVERLAPSRFFVDGLGSTRLEAACPVIWHAVGIPAEPSVEAADRLRRALAGRPYVTVRDRFSKERLERAGVEVAVEVVPDSALLLDRLVPAAVLASRLGRLRDDGYYPAGPALVVQGCDLLVDKVAEVAAALRSWLGAHPEVRPVLVETGGCRGDAVFAGELAPRLGPGRVYRLPPSSGVEDLAAAIGGGFAFAGSSLHGAITAMVYGRPFVLLNLAGESKLEGFGDLTGLGDRIARIPTDIAEALDRALATAGDGAGLLAVLQRRIDAHFDRVADLAARAAAGTAGAARRSGDPAEMSRRLDRDAIAALLLELRSELEHATSDLAEARHRAGVAEAELAALRGTRTFRYSDPLRRLYHRLYHHRRRG